MREERFEVVSVLDPAIDRDATTQSMIDEYAVTRDISKLRFLPGVEPTRFFVREIPRVTWLAFVQAASSDSVRLMRAFMAGVESVRGLYEDDGTFLPEYAPSQMREIKVMDEASLERFSPADITEIGQVVYTHSFLARRIERSYPLPRSVAEQLEALQRHRAEQSRSTPVSSNGAASSVSRVTALTPASDSTPSAADSSGSNTAAPTDATAMAS